MLSYIMSAIRTLRSIFIDLGTTRWAPYRLRNIFIKFIRTIRLVGILVVPQIIRVLEVDHFYSPIQQLLSRLAYDQRLRRLPV